MTDNLLDLVDQTVFLGEQATGATSLIQCAWIYDGGADLDGLREFHQHLQHGRLSRRVERSPLAFGRHRWVTPQDTTEIEIATVPRPRADFDAWLSEQADTPLDCERGPGWHLAVLPFTDGGSGVSLVISHTLTDGVGICLALADAAAGRDDAVEWPAAGSRRRWRAVRQDAAQTMRDVPAVARALRAAARMARQHRKEAKARVRAPKAVVVNNDRLTLPMATAFIDVADWDTRARLLGGTSNALLAGLAVDVARRIGRVNADGTITVAIPVNERIDGDTRSNAVTNVDVMVAPSETTADLSGLRAGIKAALIRHNDVPDERWALLPIVPLLPKRVVRRMVSVASGGDTASVISSNIGDIDPVVNRPDGTDADQFTLRSRYPGITRATMHRAGGVLAFASGRINGRVFITVLSYQPGGMNSDSALQQTLSHALADLSLTPTDQANRVSTMRKTA